MTRTKRRANLDESLENVLGSRLYELQLELSPFYHGSMQSVLYSVANYVFVKHVRG